MSLLNPVGLAANLISYGVTGNSLLENVANGILKNTAGISYDEAVSRATQAIKQAGSGSIPQPAPQMGGTVVPAGVGSGQSPINSGDFDRGSFATGPSPTMRYDDQTVGAMEMRNPARR
jgi:hypothetical protein